MISRIRDRILQARLARDERYFKIGFVLVTITITLLLFNIVYLNFIANERTTHTDTIPSGPQISESPAPSVTEVLPSPTVQTSNPVNTNATNVNPQVKDYYIPLGSGTVQSQQWMSVPGVQATVDFGDYQNIQSVLFEASISLPAASQTVSVQLFDVTDNQPVWNSTMSTNGASSQYLVSQPLIYETGLKTYQVQMQNQLLAPATLVQSRIHIILE